MELHFLSYIREIDKLTDAEIKRKNPVDAKVGYYRDRGLGSDNRHRVSIGLEILGILSPLLIISDTAAPI